MDRVLKSTLIKMLLCVCVCALIALVYVPMYVFADASTNTITVTFRDGYTEEQGYVEYSLNDGANWTKVTENIYSEGVYVTGDNLRIRIVPETGYQVDFAGISYSENSEEPLSLNDSANSAIAGGLTGSNGYYVTATATSVSLENVEFRHDDSGSSGQGNDPNPGQGDNPEPHNFDGRAVVVWSCGTGVCYHSFDDIPNFDDGRSTFYSTTQVEADNKPGTFFDVDAKYKAWYLTDTLGRWVTNYKVAKNIEGDIDFNTVDPADLINLGGAADMRSWEDKARQANSCPEITEECVDDYAATQGFIHSYQLRPVGEPEGNNAYVSYGDRNFKVIIYNNIYKGISMGNLDDLHYYPSSWQDPFLMRDQFDVSGSTRSNPALMDSILLESTVTIKALNYNSFEISSIESLDVPKNAVTITKENNGDFKLVFSSNFYDNVLFKITDSNGQVSYLKIKRYTIDGWIRYIDNHPVLFADFYFDRNKSYSDFDLTAKIYYKNGKTKNVKLSAMLGVDDGLGNLSNSYEIDEESMGGRGLKKAAFGYKLADGEDKNIKKVYLNAENKGSTATNYAGAYVGSGQGILANIYQEGDE